MEDLEDILAEDERLFITAGGPGSFDLTFIIKKLNSLKSLVKIAPLFYDEGREALLERVRSTTDLKALDVVERKNEIELNRLKGIIDLAQKIDKIEDPYMRGELQRVISTNLRAVGEQPLSLSPPCPDLSEDRDE